MGVARGEWACAAGVVGRPAVDGSARAPRTARFASDLYRRAGDAVPAANSNPPPTMRYLIAIVLPPLAVLLCGKPVQFLLNIVLTLFFWVPGMIHALLVVHEHLADERAKKIIRAIEHRS
jgi:uncharacterized membrane protein YqaE (UPF0057 family)